MNTKTAAIANLLQHTDGINCQQLSLNSFVIHNEAVTIKVWERMCSTLQSLSLRYERYNNGSSLLCVIEKRVPHSETVNAMVSLQCRMIPATEYNTKDHRIFSDSW